MSNTQPSTPGITAAAHAYQEAMAQQAQSLPVTPAEPKSEPVDAVMADIDSPANPSPTPNRVGTPSRLNGNSESHSSRQGSVHPEPVQTTMPTEAALHGAPVRQYLNSKVVSSLLEGTKLVAREQPKDPLRVLGEFLLQKSRELEGT